MSGRSVSSDLVTQNQPRKVKKFYHKANKNKNRQISKREIFNEQPVLVDNEKGKEGENKEEIKARKAKVPKEKDTFPQYIPETEIDKLLRNENSNETQYIEGQLRVNPWNREYAYLSFSDDQCDLLIIGLRDRNRAFDGDFVVARINQPEKWKMHQGYNQKTGVVVYIREKIHPRRTIGYFKENGKLFYPRDRRVPLVKISKKSLQQFGVCQNYKDILYLVVITDWRKPKFAVGKIEKIIGSIGDIKAESNAILLEYDLDVTPYSLDVTKELPSSDYSLTENDIKDREDWKDECIFTIDPDTAVDLDDSVSCKPLENGNYEIGVHISDVTHYVEFLSPLDIQVSKRATTIYMADNVYHMLPKELCQVCSLSPGQDKLAFSVIWEMTQDARVVNYRFAKTVIRSCCQMSYQHVQKMIENPEYNWPDNSINIDGNYKLNDLSTKVNILHNLAIQMRKRRFQNGALLIDQPKLCVRVDRITGLPISYNIEEQQDSNRLIEEFMLLANMTVATHLYNVIPETALLRNHREPSKRILSMTQEMLQKFGIHLDIKSSRSLHASMKHCEEALETEDDERRIIMKYRMMVVNNLCSRAMTRATYICSSTVKAEEELRHYALNISVYTHFTSPIRRYSDCVVHRLLYSTLRNIDMPKEWTKSLCKSIAANCNIKKYNAKMAQERSNELYFTYLIDLKGPIVTMGIVFSVHESLINIILCQFGIKLRVSFTHLENLALVEYSSECSIPTINISWKQPAITQVINVFTLLHLRVEKHPESFQLIGTLLPPTQGIEI
ncbi:DIS3-like exonuclease 2 isoform X1 [Bombus huntii]|uniref:DIS3-like exonuclease 2 isoform X1 n=2 Tax=Bombus huntii TaxID=85661 RepID=UPI0021AAEEC8|nr:DIS3-like exonuclease 2 isoform X1 [Bombus huntii]